MDSLVLVLFFALVALFVMRAWKVHGRLSAPDRWALITSFSVAITTFVIALFLINWVIVSIVFWYLAVILVAVGVVGAVLRWPDLAWYTSPHPLRRASGIGVTLLICTLLISVALL